MRGYFNYFTEIEEHFRAARGTALFMLSPRDWVQIERWKDAGVPLEAVLRGIDRTFAQLRRRSGPGSSQTPNTLAYCAPAITEEARAMANAMPAGRCGGKPPFTLADVQNFTAGNAGALRKAGYNELASKLDALDLGALYTDFEQLEKRLTQIEEEMIARLRAAATDEAMCAARRALDCDLKPYRGRMTADQLNMLEEQFLDRRLLEAAALPRLSLFYL